MKPTPNEAPKYGETNSPGKTGKGFSPPEKEKEKKKKRKKEKVVDLSNRGLQGVEVLCGGVIWCSRSRTLPWNGGRRVPKPPNRKHFYLLCRLRQYFRCCWDILSQSSGGMGFRLGVTGIVSSGWGSNRLPWDAAGFSSVMLSSLSLGVECCVYPWLLC